MISLIVNRLIAPYETLSCRILDRILHALYLGMKGRRLVSPAFRARLREKNLTAVIRTRDGRVSRTFVFTDGRVSSEKGLAPGADAVMIFRSASCAVRLMAASADFLAQINAMKNFQVDVEGADPAVIWFMQTLNLMKRMRMTPAYGVPMGGGVVRYTNNTNGGPVFV